ncbi:hypothetical protein Ancab_025525 [Ancistrocladus abbreviatus]
MNERNLLHSSHHQIDFGIGQPPQSHLHPEPCIIFGGTLNFPQSNMHQVLPASGNINNFELHHLPEHHDGATYYGMMQYTQQHHPATNLELGAPAGSAFYNLHINPTSSSRMFPIPVSHGPVDQLPSSSSYRGNTVPVDDYGRSNFPTDVLRGSCKRKNAEGIPGNAQFFDVSAGPSSSISSMSGSHFDSGVTMMDASYPLPEYRSNGPLPIMEAELQGNGRNRAGAAGLHRDSIRTHGYSHLLQGNLMSQHFQPPGTLWLDQQSVNNGCDGGNLPWNGAPLLPCFQGNNLPGGPLEIGNASLQGYHDAATNRSSTNFLPSPIINQPHNLHPAPCIQGVRGYSVNYHPPVAATSSRHPTTNALQHGTISDSHDDIESLPPPSGFRMYRSHRRGVLPEAMSRHRNVPHLRILPADEVAIWEIPSFYEVGSFIDHHRDMRLDIDDMSYEELLALSERIGSVNTGLSEEAIAKHLKIRLYCSMSATNINLEELPSSDQKEDSCIICQEEYEDNDNIGTLDCGHEYHADCLKQWLNLKNVCPICKLTALSLEEKGR